MKMTIALKVLAMLFLVSCASMRNDWINSNCNYETAYSKGNNDRDGGSEMRNDDYVLCPSPQKEQALKGYREGYEKARKEENQVSSAPSNVNIGGVHINLPPKEKKKAFYCSIDVFGKTFEAFGKTKLEARKSAANQCKAEYHQIQCKKVSCKKNK